MANNLPFEERLINELHELKNAFVRLETKFENLADTKKDVIDLKKKIQNMEIEQAVHKTKLWFIGATAGIVISLGTNIFLKWLDK